MTTGSTKIVGAPWGPFSYKSTPMLRSPQINATKIHAAAWPRHSVRMLCTFVRDLADFLVSPHPSCSGLPGLRKIVGCHFKTHKKPMEVTDVDWKSQWHTTVQYYVQYILDWKSRLEQQLPGEFVPICSGTSPSSRPMKRLALKMVRSGERPLNVKPMEDMAIIYRYSILSLTKKNELNKQ